jgi:hypothetical protein
MLLANRPAGLFAAKIDLRRPMEMATVLATMAAPSVAWNAATVTSLIELTAVRSRRWF